MLWGRNWLTFGSLNLLTQRLQLHHIGNRGRPCHNNKCRTQPKNLFFKNVTPSHQVFLLNNCSRWLKPIKRCAISLARTLASQSANLASKPCVHRVVRLLCDITSTNWIKNFKPGNAIGSRLDYLNFDVRRSFPTHWPKILLSRMIFSTLPTFWQTSRKITIQLPWP